MGTAKRERQKANRQLRLEELAKQARQQKAKRTGLRIGAVVAVVVVIVAAVHWLGGSSTSSTPATTAASTVPSCVPADSSTFQPIAPPAKPTVTVPTATPTELKVTPLTAGTGPAAQACDTVRVYYVGVLSADGTEFDSNYASGTTFDLVLGQGRVIEGWDQGLLGVQAGGRYQLDIPAALAYKDQANGSIPANSALTFVVDVMAVVPPTSSTTSTVPTTGSTVASTGTSSPATSAPTATT